MRHITDVERRARLARRHAIAPSHRVADAVAATRAMTVLHATEPPSVHLAVAARTEGVSAQDVERALYAERSLVKQLAMRRTLFVFPRDLLPAAWGSASARVALSEGRRLVKSVEEFGGVSDGGAWLASAREEVLALLAGAGGVGLGAQEIRRAVPRLDVSIATSATGNWGGPIPIAPRVLTWLGAQALIVRGVNAGHWRISKPAWTPMGDWLGQMPAPEESPVGYIELVRRWLWTFGPGTEADLVWWLGATKSIVRAALAALEAVPVGLDGGGTGWVLPDDEALDRPIEPVEPWAALLPVLDPTTMGWKERAFHLDPGHAPYLFDSAGNGGTTAWVDGRVVGCWVQDDAGAVRVVLREDVPSAARRLLDVEADRLTAWLGGVVISSVYKSRQMIGARLP